VSRFLFVGRDIMLLLGCLAKIQGLKGEFILHDFMDDPKRITKIHDLFLAPPNLDLEHEDVPTIAAKIVKIRSFRMHKNRACIAFEEILDRTASYLYRNWQLWTTSSLPILSDGESYRHDWIGCTALVDGIKVGEVVCLRPTPMEYDMVVIQDMRPDRNGYLEVPYIRSWFQIDFDKQRVIMDLPPGLLDLVM